jgi:hydroxymethylpyrimidine/phosphomethylpyrimidine kinase
MLPRALTIAGSDPSGGAGIQADLKTFTVFRVYGMSAVTALTAQNTLGVTGIVSVSPDFVGEQIRAVVEDIGVDAAKTGMLANEQIVAAVAGAVRAYRIEPLVVDPVMVAQSGSPLLTLAAVRALREHLIPLATVLTPNAPEAAALLDAPVASLAQMRDAARRLLDLGPRAVLVKGGHVAQGSEAIDVFHDGNALHELCAARVDTRHTHGTGCMLSSAITACLASGMTPLDAVHRAKRFITLAVSAGLALGAGNGPANPLAWLDEEALGCKD